MDTAQKILIIGGLLMVVLGIVSGNVMGLTRLKPGHPKIPRYLALAHEGAYVQGALLLALSVAVSMSTLSAGWETLAAWLLVIAAVMLFVKDIVNWVTRTDDEFSKRGPGLALGFLQAPLHTLGVAILAVGCLQAL